MDLFIIAGAVIVAILLFFLFRSKGRKPVSRSKNATAAGRNSVEIQPGLMCCTSVKKIANQVFLAQEAPGLPLGVCTLKKCQCKYKFLDDRRSGEDRRTLLSHLGAMLERDEDRRSVTGRRESDLAF